MARPSRPRPSLPQPPQLYGGNCTGYVSRGPRPHGRRRFARLATAALYAAVRADILAHAPQTRLGGAAVTAEHYANYYRVPVHRITQLFRRLNQEGLLYQRRNHSPTRGDYRWRVSTYTIVPVEDRHAPRT